MPLSFLTDLFTRLQPEQVIPALTHTPYDELLVLNIATGQYESRYHTDGKFFAPVDGGDFSFLINYSSSNLIHPEDLEAHAAFMNLSDMPERFASASPKGILRAEFRFLAISGEWRRMENVLISGSQFGLPENTVYYYLFDVHNILSREAGQQQASSRPAKHLLNQMPDQTPESLFFSMVQERLKSPSEDRWCLIAIDIKHFKLFKELNGQDKGEQLLVRFAEILHAAAQDAGGLSCYRGQDDYALYFPYDQFRIDRVFQELCRAIDSISRVSGFFPIFGISTIDGEFNGTALELFNQAALTAEEIKDDLQYHIRVYDPKVHERHVEEFTLLSDFTNALKNGEISFYLQPQCRVANGKIVGAESLARWNRPDGTSVSPVFFIPVLEKYGAVTDLDLFIWDSVCAWLRHVIDEGLDPVPISVNVSRIDMFSMDVAAHLSGLLEKHSLPVNLLKVEITESAYVDDSDQIHNTIAALRARGFQVLMDDFGSGYSSLNMLRSMNMDVIKLDAQFLHFNAGEEQKGINILESVINMTKSLSTPIIVEGVDTRELVQYLTDLGCRYMQGFYFYRPMPGAQFEKLLQDPDKFDHNGIRQPIHEQIHIREFLDDSIHSDAMLNNILGPVAFYRLKDSNVDIIRFNQQFFRMLGLEPEQLEARRYHIQEFFLGEDVDAFFHMLHNAKINKISGDSGFFRVYKPDGALFWMQLHVYWMRDEDGAAIFYGAARDMTELLYINEDLPGGYLRCRTGDAMEFLYISQGFVNMFGYTESEIRLEFDNKMINMVNPNDRERVVRESAELVSGNRTVLTPYRVCCKDGTVRYVVDQARFTDRFGEPCFQSVLIDITEVMTLRNRMRVLEKHMQEVILFLRNVMDPSTADIVVYGLEDVLKMSREDFEKALRARQMSIVSMMGDSLAERMVHQAQDPSCLNGMYILVLPNGKRVRVHVRFSLTDGDSEGVPCIFSLTPATI